MSNVLRKIADVYAESRAAALCLVVNTKGSTPRKPGAKMLVYTDGRIEGTIGGGELEKNVITDALRVIKTGAAVLRRHDLLHQHNMCCGGSVDVYIEPLMKKNNLYIFGAGHIGMALAKYAADLDFEVVLIDDRKEFIDQCTINVINKMPIDFLQATQLLPFDERTHVCIMTYDHATDREILAHCIKKPFAYLGMIGSKRKIEVTKKIFLSGGLASMEELQKVEMPMGIDIGAEGPSEIAISILSRLIKVRHLINHA